MSERIEIPQPDKTIKTIDKWDVYEGFAQTVYELGIEILEYRILMLFSTTLKELDSPLAAQGQIGLE